jgi:hypothetical protein
MRLLLPAVRGKTGQLCFMLSLSFALLFAYQEFGPERIAMGNHFAYAQEKQRDDTRPEKGIAPPASPFDRSPARPPIHDDLPFWLLPIGIAFPIGFKIAAHMNRNHALRLRRMRGE